MKQFCLQLRLLALKTLQDQPREAYTSPDKASNAIPVGNGGEAPPGWCSVQQLSHDYRLVDRV